ncbi:MAG: hypothetical protein HY321_19650 [Armatimonadetes bacterium]|nr:hypothetical protein [Armatimonadota bacterium]
MLEIEVGFDGSCPQSPDGVRREGDTTFRILPSWRPEPGVSEECLGRTTRLGFRVRNSGALPVAATLHVDWQYDEAPPDAPRSFQSREHYMSLRDFCVAQDPGIPEWRYLMADVAGSVATLRLGIEPGVTEIHWHPPYNYARGEAFVADVRGQPYTSVEHLGQSQGERNLWLIRIRGGSGGGAPFFVRARTHAYESAGSYMMEGMVRFLLGSDPWAAVARRDYEFFFLPMANPDGVHDGMGRLTAPRGSDLVLATPAIEDPAYIAMMSAVERIRPAHFIDIHNWQGKFSDGLLGMDPARREPFFHYMPPAGREAKRWYIRDPENVAGPVPSRETLGRYCRRVYGARAASFEVSWFGRSPADVRRFGADALRAILITNAAPADPETI